MAKKTSMEDIAQKLGLSRNTISLTLRGAPGISDSTRRLILDTAASMGYVYNKKTTLSERISNLSKSICLILSKDTLNAPSFFASIQFSIEDEARKNNMNIILHCFDERQNEFETPICIKEEMVSGIITLGRISEKSMRSIVSFNLPVIMVDHYSNHRKLDCILTDNIHGGYEATMYLISKNHKEIGFVGDLSLSPSFQDRYEGYLKALRQYGRSFRHDIMVIDSSFESLIEKDLHHAIEIIKSMEPLPTAFFCCNDIEAISLYKVFEAIQIKVPSDVSIIGFDNIESSKCVSPELTTLHVERNSLGKRAVQRLIFRQSDPYLPFEKILIAPSLIERKSVCECMG